MISLSMILPRVFLITKCIIVTIPVFVPTRLFVKEITLGQLLLRGAEVIDQDAYHITHALDERLIAAVGVLGCLVMTSQACVVVNR